MLWIRSLQHSFDSSFTHTFFTTLIRSLTLDGCFSAIFSFISVHRFSMGLSLGLLPGHPRALTLLSTRKFVTIFNCWPGAQFRIKIVHMWICMGIFSLSDDCSTYRGPFIVVTEGKNRVQQHHGLKSCPKSFALEGVLS